MGLILLFFSRNKTGVFLFYPDLERFIKGSLRSCVENASEELLIPCFSQTVTMCIKSVLKLAGFISGGEGFMVAATRNFVHVATV